MKPNKYAKKDGARSRARLIPVSRHVYDCAVGEKQKERRERRYRDHLAKQVPIPKALLTRKQRVRHFSPQVLAMQAAQTRESVA